MGHAIYYKIIPQDNGNLTFQAFNRGAGLQYHECYDLKLKNVYLPFIEITEIKKKNIIKYSFIRAIIEHNSIIQKQSLNGLTLTNYNEIDVYEILFNSLKGTQSKRDLALEDLMSEQHNGTCLWKSLTAIFRLSFGYLPSKQLKLRMEFQALYSSYHTIKEKLPFDAFSRNILSQLISSVADTLQVTKDFISEEEYISLSSFLATLKDEVEMAKNQSILDRQTPKILYEPLGKSELEFINDSIEIGPFSFKRHRPIETFIESSSHLHSNEIIFNTEKHFPKDPITPCLNNWNPQPNVLLKDLTHFIELCHQATENGDYQEVHTFFIKVLRLLPLPSSLLSTPGGQFWEEVIRSHPCEIANLMEAFVELPHLFYVSCFKTNGLQDFSPSGTHAIIKSLHIQNILKEHSSLKEIGLDKIPGAFKFLEKFFKDSDGITRELWFRPMDPLIAEELYAIYLDLIKMSAEYKPLVFDWDFDDDHNRQTLFSALHAPNFKEDSLKENNPEFISIKNLIENSPEFLKKTNEFHQDLFINNKLVNIFDKPFLNFTLNEKIKFVYTLGANALLPSLFLRWQLQYLEAHYLLRNFCSLSINQKIENDNDLMIRIEAIEDKEKLNFYFKKPSIHSSSNNNIFFDQRNIDFTFDERYINNFRPFNNALFYNIIHIWNNTKRFKDIIKKWNMFVKGYVNERSDYSLQKSYGNQNDIYSDNYDFKGLNDTQVRELLCLGTDKLLQIEQTVAYFSKNLNLLKERDYQTLFFMLLFEENFLLKEIENNSEIISHFKDFIDRGYQFAYENANIETCIFFSNLSRHLNDFIYHVDKSKNKSLLLPKDKLQQILKLEALTQQEISLVYHELLASYFSHNSFDEREIIIIIQALTWLFKHPVDENIILPGSKKEKQEALYNFHLFIKDRDLSDIINTSLNKLISEDSNIIWKKITPFKYESNKGDLLNLINGDFWQKNNSNLINLPEDIINDWKYKTLFPTSYPALRIDYYTYSLKDENEDEYLIIKNKSNKGITVRRKIKGEWFEYVVPSYSQNSLYFNDSIINFHHIWEKITGPFQIEIFDLKGKHTSSATKQEDTGHVLIKRYPDSVITEELFWVPIFKHFSLTRFLESFEDLNYISIWKNAEQFPQLIELPRFKISFKLEKNNKISNSPRWLCQEMPGFYLASKQFVPQMNELEGYIVLENKKGEQQVILPLRKIKPSKNSTFSEKIIWGEFKNGKIKYVIYNIRKKNNTFVIEPSNIEAALYLAYIKLAIGKYEDARSLLNVYRLSLRGSQKEMEWISKIILSEEITQDNGVCGAALRLHAGYLFLELMQRMEKNDGNFDNKIKLKEILQLLTKDAELYISLISSVNTLRLPLHEEKIIFKFILESCNDSYVIQRYIETLNENEKIRIDSSYHLIKKTYFDKTEKILSKVENYNNLYYNFKLFKDLYESNDFSNEWLTIYKRLNEIDLILLLVQWMKASQELDKQKILAEIDNKLAVCPPNEIKTETVWVWSVLKMILCNPNKYSIDPPPSRDKKEEWYKSNIIPILKDFIKEYSDNQADVKNQSQLTNTKNITLRKVKLPDHSQVDVKRVGEGLSQRENLFKEASIKSNFNLHDYMSEAPKEQINLKINEKEKQLDLFAKKSEELFKETQNIGRCEANEYARLLNDCKNFIENSKNELVNGPHKILSTNQFHELKEKLGLEIQALKIALREQEEMIDIMVNPPEIISNLKDAKHSGSSLSGQHQRISIETLILLFGRKQMDALAINSSFLKLEYIPYLQDKMISYLEQATYLQQLERSLLTVETCLKQVSKEGKANPDDVEKLLSEMSNKRCIDPYEYPEGIVLEYWANLLIRRDQVDHLKTFCSNDKIQPVLQIIMGAGKTSVLMPLIALLLANGSLLIGSYDT